MTPLPAWARRVIQDWHDIGDLLDQAQQPPKVTPATITVYGDQGEMRHPGDTTTGGW